MNFGFSPSDLVTLIDLVAKAYNGWKRACGEYADITTLLDDLLLSLERIEREAEQPHSVLIRATKDREDLDDIFDGCRPTVRELHRELSKYDNLGRSRQRNWERLRFGIKNLDELRTKLTGHKTAITLYLSTVGISSNTRIEAELRETSRPSR